MFKEHLFWFRRASLSNTFTYIVSHVWSKVFISHHTFDTDMKVEYKYLDKGEKENKEENMIGFHPEFRWDGKSVIYQS